MTAPSCALCGWRTATYVCRDCGRTICGSCFDPVGWLCSDCQTKLRSSRAVDRMPPTQLPIGTWLFFIALGVIFVGILLIALGSLSTLNGVSGGAVIIIGPIPIVLGAGQYSFALAALAAILTVCALIFYLFLRKRT